MKTVREPARDTPVLRETDVLVVGGGPAGFSAAVAAARLGSRVTLVERYGHLGGLATGGLVFWLPGYHPGGSRVYGGLALEWVQRVEMAGGTSYRDITESKQGVLADPEMLKQYSLEMVLEAGVDLLLHAFCAAAIVENGSIKGAIIESKSGRQAILAGVVVDGTGDADLVAWANGQFVTGTKGISLPYRLGGIDWDRYQAFHQDEPERFAELTKELKEEWENRMTFWPHPRSHNDLAWMNYWGPLGFNAIDVEDLTRAEILLRKNISGSVHFLRKNVPGFERCFLVDTACQIGTRDSRRIVGDYTLTMHDLTSQMTFPDTIGRMCNNTFVDVTCDIPYRCLVPQGVENLLVAGRPIDADPQVHEASRLIPPSMATGQAAGTAAHVAIRDGVTPRGVGLARVQATLHDAGVFISTLAGPRQPVGDAEAAIETGTPPRD